MSLELTPCCPHCGCPFGYRTGHDDSCSYGCNDAPALLEATQRVCQRLANENLELSVALRRLASGNAGEDDYVAALALLARIDPTE